MRNITKESKQRHGIADDPLGNARKRKSGLGTRNDPPPVKSNYSFVLLWTTIRQRFAGISEWQVKILWKFARAVKATDECFDSRYDEDEERGKEFLPANLPRELELLENWMVYGVARELSACAGFLDFYQRHKFGQTVRRGRNGLDRIVDNLNKNCYCAI